MHRRNFLGALPLAVGAGASLLTLAQPANAQSSSNPQIANVQTFGAIGDGIHDDTSAVQAAFTSVANGGTVIFPPGRYLLTSKVSLTLAAARSLSIIGYGQDSSVLYFPTGSGVSVSFLNQFCSIHVRDLSLTTGRAGPADTAFFVQQNVACNTNPALNPLSDFTNVTIRGDDGYGINDYWGVGVDAVDVSLINFTNFGYFGSGLLGNGVNVTGADRFTPCGGNAAFGVVYNFYGCTFERFNAAIVYGTEIQGMAIVSCNFTQGNIGVLGPSGEAGLDQLSITTSQFGSLNNAIYLQSKINATTIACNLFIIDKNQNGIVLNSDSSCVTGNVFAGNGPSNNNGVYVLNTIQSIITGNSFSDLLTGVALLPAASGVNIQSNSYRNVATQVFNNGGTGNTLGGGSL